MQSYLRMTEKLHKRIIRLRKVGSGGIQNYISTFSVQICKEHSIQLQ
jgi:hypothetical protein